jgi:hypothetical protein
MNKFQSAIWAEDFATAVSQLISGRRAAGEFSERGLKLYSTHGHMDPSVVAQVESDRWHAEQPICECRGTRIGPCAARPRSSIPTSVFAGAGTPSCR